MKKIINIFAALTVMNAYHVLKNIASDKTQNLVINKTSNGGPNGMWFTKDTSDQFWFSVYLTNSDYNGFSGFLDQISFSLSDDNYHAWPLYFFQWLDDDDFHSGPMPALNSHTKHGFFHWPLPFTERFETNMGHFGSWTDDKSDTAYHMSINYGLWGTFGQNVDNQWNADRAASKALIGVQFDFAFDYYGTTYETDPPDFDIIIAP